MSEKAEGTIAAKEIISGESIDSVSKAISAMVERAQVTREFPGHFPVVASILGVSFTMNLEKPNTLDEWDSSCRIVIYPRQMPENNFYLKKVLGLVFPREGETIKCNGKIMATMLQVSAKKVIIIGEPCGNPEEELARLQSAVIDICFKNPDISPAVCYIEPEL